MWFSSTPQLSSNDILERKARYATDILRMYDIICPGLTKERGLTLFQLFAANFQMIKAQAANLMCKEANSDNTAEHTPGNELLNCNFRSGIIT